MATKINLHADTINRAYVPYLLAPERYQIYFGGSSSGKSVFLATRVAIDALQGRNTLVVRKVGRTIRGSCWNEIIKAISRMNLLAYFDISKSETMITAKNNGAQILFAGLDDVEKVKSITPQNGALTDVWMEEATECGYEDFKQLDKRLRGLSRHSKRMTLSFNPVYQTHWLYKAFFGIWQDGATVARSADTLILKTTYKDNRFLTDDDRAALEREKDPYFYAVYTLGNWGALGDTIFRNWRTEDLSGIEQAYPLRFYGLDFGFASDPCAAVNCAYDRKHGRIYIFSELYEKGLTNSMLAERLHTFCGNAPITCDSAEPKSIAELRGLGVRAVPAKKGADSVVHGIQWLKQSEIIIDVTCVHLREEFTLYQWRKDKDGNSMPVPEDRNNHLIDALRYALEAESQQKIIKIASKEVYGL